ncbi:MAG TPA: phosphonate C-P lyase system protein PhnL [Acetobacteraceae bacterium]|nr:phosphonate C-P lyase system protein PhnL [Acetobacteraceae bacterium]
MSGAVPLPSVAGGEALLLARRLGKSFTLHLQGGLRIPVLKNVALELRRGECVMLSGPSGIGKSTLMRSLYGNYRVEAGEILIRHGGGWIDLATADPRIVIAMRRHTIGHVSQFLRVVPRVPTIEIVAEPARLGGSVPEEARERARALLLRLNIPLRLHELPPATFSGGERQRVNLARGFAGGHPILLLDEPTASLDAENGAIVTDLVNEAKASGVAILGIMHDTAARDAIADRLFSLQPYQDAA